MENKYVCAECGSSDVEARVWAKVNTGEISGSIDVTDNEDCWCCICEEHNELIPEDEYLANKEM